ncbi:hypothetical protein ACFYVL_44240 [Streptomyces sp. NPDC004111]|uniref:hypothetical protein n=1 Tax=Streptomyces sp. NPDC004111 TaxID=3364690 RepID=UPI0036CBE5C1
MTTSPPPAGPVPVLADAAADAVCALADAVTYGWPADRSGTHDALDALDILLAALAQLDTDAARLLAPAVLAATRLRHHLDGDQDDGQEAGGVPAAPAPAPTVPAPRTPARPRRRGLGPGYRGLAL